MDCKNKWPRHYASETFQNSELALISYLVSDPSPCLILLQFLQIKATLGHFTNTGTSPWLFKYQLAATIFIIIALTKVTYLNFIFPLFQQQDEAHLC